MLNFFIGFAFFEAGAIFGFFVAALLNAAHVGQESTIFEDLLIKVKSQNKKIR